jgi:dTDP-4-dehydrorhamnose reductase
MNGNKLLVTGSTGLVGSAFVTKYPKITISAGRKNCDQRLDLSKKKQIIKVVSKTNASVIINFAAYTNVDAAEEQKGDKGGEVYTINTLAPFWLAKACRKHNKSFIHISTDYVFDGMQDKRPYKESDPANPLNSWYSQTKYQAEKKIVEVFDGKGSGWAIVRISFPYSDKHDRKLDIARAVVARLKDKQSYLGIINQKIKPTHVNKIAEAIYLLVKKQVSGIFHVAGYWPNGYISPHDFALLIAKKYRFKEFFKNRPAPRPQHTWRDTGKIEKLGMNF